MNPPVIRCNRAAHILRSPLRRQKIFPRYPPKLAAPAAARGVARHIADNHARTRANQSPRRTEAVGSIARQDRREPDLRLEWRPRWEMAQSFDPSQGKNQFPKT